MNPWDLLGWAGAIGVSLIILVVPAMVFCMGIRIVTSMQFDKEKTDE